MQVGSTTSQNAGVLTPGNNVQLLTGLHENRNASKRRTLVNWCVLSYFSIAV